MTGFHDFKALVNYFIGLINLALPVVVGIALLVFIWGLIKFISKSGDAASHKEGRSLMIWGIIALFAMISYKGLIGIAQSTLGIHDGVDVLPLIKPTQ